MTSAAANKNDPDRIYGYRARIGYTAPPFISEIFAYEFYHTAPPGVTLAITTLALGAGNPEVPDELAMCAQITKLAIKAFARTSVNLLVLGGIPINLMTGSD